MWNNRLVLFKKQGRKAIFLHSCSPVTKIEVFCNCSLASKIYHLPTAESVSFGEELDYPLFYVSPVIELSTRPHLTVYNFQISPPGTFNPRCSHCHPQHHSYIHSNCRSLKAAWWWLLGKALVFFARVAFFPCKLVISALKSSPLPSSSLQVVKFLVARDAFSPPGGTIFTWWTIFWRRSA